MEINKIICKSLAFLKRKLLHDFTPFYISPKVSISLQRVTKKYFHKPHFSIDKVVAFSIIDSKILTTTSFSKGVVDGKRPLKFP
jgi:hypothetical protein